MKYNNWNCPKCNHLNNKFNIVCAKCDFEKTFLQSLGYDNPLTYSFYVPILAIVVYIIISLLK